MGGVSDGARTLGAYRITGVVGEGGMGVVYQGVHETTGERVAIKTVRVNHESQLSSIRREILALMRLSHPGVVRVIGSGLDGGVPWYAMELLEGQTLSDYGRTSFSSISSQMPRQFGGDEATREFLPTPRSDSSNDMPTNATEVSFRPAPVGRRPAAGGRLQDALTVVRRLCEPLAYLHGEGIVHRDIKSSNVFVRERLRPVLVDFGLAWRFGATGREELDVTMPVAGTAGYMAPEQFRGELVDARADLYALGCVLFEIVTGRLPFEGTSILEVRSGHLALHPPLPSSMVDGVPPGLDELILRMLEKRPRDRLGHALDVARLLDGLGAEPDTSSRAAPPRAYVYRPAFAGREDALALLGEQLTLSWKGQGACTLVGGSSGIGKTYLAMALARQASTFGFQVVADSCLPVGSVDDENAGRNDAPLHPFRKLLQVVADRCIERGPASTEQLIGAQARLLIPYEPSLRGLPGLEAYPEPAEVPAQMARARLLEALGAVIRAMAAATPLLLLIDDLQWADELSLELLASLSREALAGVRLMVLGTYRSEETPEVVRALIASKAVGHVALSRLDERTVGALVGDMLALESPPRPLVHFLASRCEGNPFFVAEYLRTAVGEGLLARTRSGQWQIAGATPDAITIPLPTALGELVLRRLGSLSERARQLVGVAAVFGRECETPLLLEAAGLREQEAMEAVVELIARQVLEEQVPGRLRFVHDKLREGAYEAVGAARRREVHLRAASVLEARHRGEEGFWLLSPTLARHFTNGGDLIKAIEYLELAAEHAESTFSNHEVLGFVEEAMALDTQGGEASGDWTERLGRAHLDLQAFKVEGSPANCRRAAGLRRARWERRICAAVFHIGALDRVLQHAERALTHLGIRLPQGSSEWLLDLLRNAPLQILHRLDLRPSTGMSRLDQEIWGEAALAMQRFSERYYYESDALPMLAASLSSVNLAEKAALDVNVARPYGMLGLTVGLSRLPALGQRYFALAREAALRTRDDAGHCFVLYAKVAWRIGDGDWDEVRALCAEAMVIAERINDQQALAFCQTFLAHVEFYLGQFERSQQAFSALAAAARVRANPQITAWGLYAAARALLPLQRAEEACVMLEEAHSLLEPLHDVPSNIISAGLLAVTHERLGHHDEAARWAEIATARIRKNLPTVFSTLSGYEGVAEVYLGAWERDPGSAVARRRARRAVADLLSLAVNIPIGWPSYQRLQGVERWQSGQPRLARALWERSIRSARALSMPHEEGLAHLALARTARPGSADREGHLGEVRRIEDRLDCPLVPDFLDA
jgi:serine/threonine protein kinase/tetratricopeptide (TPR) repeat protein